MTTPSSTDHEQLEHEAAAALSKKSIANASSEKSKRYGEYNQHVLATVILPRYGSATLHRLIAAAPLLDESALQFLLIERVNDDHINDWITVELSALTEVMDTDPVVRGLHDYKNLAPQQDGNYPPRRVEQVSAITRATAHLLDFGRGITYDVDEEGFNTQHIEDPRLRDLLTTHGNPKAVADVITQRGVTDTDQITALIDSMNSTAQAVRDGAL